MKGVRALFQGQINTKAEMDAHFGWGPYPSEEDRKEEFEYNKKILLSRIEEIQFEGYEDRGTMIGDGVVGHETEIRSEIERKKQEAADEL